MKKKTVAILLAASASYFSYAAPTTQVVEKPNFVCVADSMAGLRAGANWAPANFNPQQIKLVVKPLSDELAAIGKGSTHGVFQIGADLPDHYCVYEDEHWISCPGTIGSFQMDTKSGRFTKYVAGSYVYGVELMDAYIAVGKCTKL